MTTPTGRPTGHVEGAVGDAVVGVGVRPGCADDSLCAFHPAGFGLAVRSGGGPQVNDRDLAVVRGVAALRLVTGRQIERLHFREGSPLTQARRARGVLSRLHRLGLVDRLDRRIGGVRAGSAGYVYRLAPRGRRLLGLRGPAGGARRTLPQPSEPFQDHVLAVAEVAVTLHDAHRDRRLDLVAFEAEPASWRHWAGLGGERRQLRPDAFVTVAVGAYERLWFVEVDRGTETYATVVAKLDAYRSYAASGQEQERHGVFPRVAVLTAGESRRAALADLVASTAATDLVAVDRLGHAAAVLAGREHRT